MQVNWLKRCTAVLLGVFMICTMPGVTVFADSSSSGASEVSEDESVAESSSEVDLSGVTLFTFNENTVTVTEGDSANYEVVVYDDTDTETDPDESEDADGNTVYSVPDGSSGELRVSIKKKGGEYAFTGIGYGSIAVKKEATKDAVLYLDGLTLESAITAVISVGKNSSAAYTIYVVDGTDNTLTDNLYNNDETYTDNAAAENAVIKCKDASDVIITGSGTLTVCGNGKNGIKANNLLTITDADDNTLFTATVSWNSTSSATVNYVLYTDESIESGSSYTLLVNGSSESSGSGTQPGGDQPGTQPGGDQPGTQPGGGQSGTQPDDGQEQHTHSYTLSNTVAATCTAAGYYEYTCSCGNSYRVAISATGHSYTSTVTAATCTTAGYTTHTCTACGYSYKTNYTAATGHSWDSGVITKAATCDTTGIMTYTCTTCGATYTSVIAATGLSAPVISSAKNTTSGVKITWSVVDEASGYYIYRSTSKSGTYTKIATVSSGSTVTYTNKSSGTYKVTSGKTYYYKVVAYHGGTVSSMSAAKGRRYLTYGKITSLKNSTCGITLKWNKVTGASGYYIYRKASTASSYTLVKTITKASKLTYTDTKVKSKNGTVYTYKVVPYYKNSSGTVTKASCKTKKIVRLTTTSISSVSNSSSKKITVKWKKNSKASGYQIQYSTSSSFSGSKKVTVTKAASVSKTIGSLTKGKTYYVRVRSYKTVSGTKYYSAWSAKKSIKVTV